MRIGSAKQTYAADAALFDSTTQRAWLVTLAAALLVFPFFAGEYWLYLACLVAINVASATGLNILTGYTGLVSLGQAAFMGIGAYTVAILQLRWGLGTLTCLMAGGLSAMACGIVVGLPSLRVKGLYLAIATIAAGVIAHFVFQHLAITGGSAGLTLKPARLFGVDLDNSFRFYWLVMPLTAALLYGAANLFAPASAAPSSPSAIATSRPRCWAFRCFATSCCRSPSPRSTPAWRAACLPTSFAPSPPRASRW